MNIHFVIRVILKIIVFIVFKLHISTILYSHKATYTADSDWPYTFLPQSF